MRKVTKKFLKKKRKKVESHKFDVGVINQYFSKGDSQ